MEADKNKDMESTEHPVLTSDGLKSLSCVDFRWVKEFAYSATKYGKNWFNLHGIHWKNSPPGSCKSPWLIPALPISESMIQPI